MSYNTEITEPFSSAGSPPADWTEREGSYTCDGSALSADDEVSNRCITHDTVLSHINHWAKIQYLGFHSNGYDGLVLRSPDAEYGPRYTIRINPAGYYELRVCGNGSNNHL